MKRIILPALAALMLTAVSCEQFKIIGEVEEVQLVTCDIKVSTDQEIKPDSYLVKLINYNESNEYVFHSDSDGNVKGAQVVPGVYTVTATAELSQSGFTYYFSGSLVNHQIVDKGNRPQMAVNAESSKSGALILKEIFYNGSEGYYFKDQFYEIYNNSEFVQYADGLCIAPLLPLVASTTTYNWQIENPDNYVFCNHIWQIPGNGTDYPIQPGESVIIAQIAQNHNSDEGRNPGNSVDLAGAEFETFMENQVVNPDNPNSINMSPVFSRNLAGAQWLVTVFGGAYVIFKTEPDKPVDNDGYVQPEGQKTMSYPIPREWVIDAVELVNNSTKVNQKRMPTSLDAGVSYTGETYHGKSVSRKIKETLPDGRIVYMDTNNSTNDFQVNEKAMVRRDGVGVPSWNTWIK